MLKRHYLRKLYLLALMPSIVFCAQTMAEPHEGSSLYARLGGKPVVDAVVVQTVSQVASDPAVNQSFKGVNLNKLTAKISDHLCALTGGGCEYKGDNMKDAHAGLKISEKEFYTMVEALRIALDGNGVGEGEKNELLRILAPMKRDVVTQ